ESRRSRRPPPYWSSTRPTAPGPGFWQTSPLAEVRPTPSRAIPGGAPAAPAVLFKQEGTPSADRSFDCIGSGVFGQYPPEEVLRDENRSELDAISESCNH